MAMDAKEKKKMMIRVIAGGVIALVIIIMVILLTSGGDEVDTVEKLGPSDSMVPMDPKSVVEVERGLLVANPNSIVFDANQTSVVVNLLASGSAILINEYKVQQDAATYVTVTSIDCPSAPQPLPANTSCSLNVAWNGTGPISSVIDISGQVYTAANAPSVPGTVQGGGEIVRVSIPISAVESVDVMGQFGDGAIDPNTGQAFNDTSGIPSQGPAPQGFADQGGGVSQPAGNPAPSPASIREQQRNAYLESRQQRGLQGVTGAPVTANARSPYAGWDGIGASGRTSSYPTDMSRVITPDKPITAVLTVPIDTRNVGTAVAMVDRDIYGNNGRTVVIPRGSKLIGTPGVTDTRVGIAWRQLIRPDGVRFVFEGTSGDANGTGGIPGRVNERLLERYGYSLLPSAVAAGITVGLGGNQVNQNNVNGVTQQIDARAVAAQILQQPLSQIAQDIFQRKSNIPVQITVPVGTRMTVWVLDDLRLKPAGQKEQPREARQQQRNGNQNQQGFRPSQQGQQPAGSAQGPNEGRGADQREEGNGDIESYGVGTIDENGNYVAPGSRAPAPSTAPLNSQNRRREQ